MPYATTQDIARANDALRGGGIWDANTRMVITQGLGSDSTFAVKAAVAVSAFNDFNKDNDPHGEHDCAVLDVDGLQVMFKIDYYEDRSCTMGADPHEQPVFRVITMMLASEYRERRKMMTTEKDQDYEYEMAKQEGRERDHAKAHPNKTYLGDGAYAELDYFGDLVLTTDGQVAKNRIVLGPTEWNALLGFVKRGRP